METNENQLDYEIELEFSKRILNNSDRLENFQYYQDYFNSLALEAQAVKGKILFIGSGPLPLSGILLQKFIGSKIDMLDYDSLAVDYGQAIIQKLGLAENLSVIRGDAQFFERCNDYNSIILALEAGINIELKSLILNKILATARPDAKILVRSSNQTGGVDGLGFVNSSNLVKSFSRRIPTFGGYSSTYVN